MSKEAEGFQLKKKKFIDFSELRCPASILFNWLILDEHTMLLWSYVVEYQNSFNVYLVLIVINQKRTSEKWDEHAAAIAQMWCNKPKICEEDFLVYRAASWMI